MREILQDSPKPDAVERLSSVVETNIQLRTTCTTTMIEGGHAPNALPQRARATIQCRMIPGDSQEYVQEAIRTAVADPITVVSVVTPSMAAPDSPLAADILGSVKRVVQSMSPEVIVLPEMSPGATDGVYTRELGIPSYGTIDGIFDDLDDVRAHGRDERIGVTAFAWEIEFTFRRCAP